MSLTRTTLARRLLVVGVTLAVITSIVAPVVGVAVAADETEPNDSRENAEQIQIGETIEGDLPESDEDWFAFTVEKGETINVSAAAAVSDDSTDFSLVTPNGEEVAGARLSDNSESFGTTATTSGTYYIEIAGVSPSRGGPAYNFTVETYETDPFEPNEDSQSATRLYQNPFPGDGATVSLNDRDWFVFTVEEGETVSVSATDAEGDLSTEFGLFTPSGSNYGARLGGESESFSPATNTSGTYFLRARGVSTSPGGGDYNFTVTLSDETLGLANDRFERPNPPLGNQDRANATDIEPGVHTDLAIVDDDRDVFAVDLAAGERVSAGIEFTHAENDLELAITDETGTALTQADSSTDGEQLGFTAPSAGTYYLTVSGQPDSAARYDLDLDVLRTVNVTVGPGSTSLPPANTTTVTVTAANVGAGLSTANLTLSASNTSVVQIQSISAAGTGAVESSITADGGTATVNVSNLEATATGQVPLVEVTLASQANGTATLSGTATVTSATGAVYPIGTVQETTVTVEPPRTVPPVVAEYDDNGGGQISPTELLAALADYDGDAPAEEDSVNNIELLELLAVYESDG